MSERYCHHVNPAGVFCGGPPLRKRDYCFWHLNEVGRRMKAARARARSERVILNLPVLDDLHAVQVGLMQLAEAIAHGEIDHQSGRLMLSVLRLAASNLKSETGWRQREAVDTFGVDANIVVEDPRFEHQYGLQKDFNLDRDPEEAFPPPKPNLAPPAPSPSPQAQSQPASHRQKRNAPAIPPAAATPLSQPLTPPAAEAVGKRKPPASAGAHQAPNLAKAAESSA